VDLLLPWLDDHRDVPFYVLLHVADPHSPFRPEPPFDSLFSDPGGHAEHERRMERVKPLIRNPTMRTRVMPTREELAAAGIDPEAYIAREKDWYDGSIRGMDTEIGRLVECLRGLGLERRSLVAFYSDHGEEFHEHGRMWHGQSVYGEMIRVPLILWAPGRIAPGLQVKEPVGLVDVMPTLLEMSGVGLPQAAQGQSLGPLLRKPGDGGVVEAATAWKQRPLVAEKQPMGSPDFPEAGESYAIVEGRWKLVHNVVRPPSKPEFELFDFYEDPLDRSDLARENPEVVERLAKALESWKQEARAARLKGDDEAAASLSAAELERLRSLGYVDPDGIGVWGLSYGGFFTLVALADFPKSTLNPWP